MRTLKELQAYFKKHKMVNAGQYDSYKYVIGAKKISQPYAWGGSYWQGGTWIGGSLAQAAHCCGVMEMGAFSGGKDEDVEHWKAVIEYALVKEKLTYLRTETITWQDPHTNLEKALVELGFRLVTTIPSKHGKREHKKYDIHVWEWLMPQVEKKAA